MSTLMLPGPGDTGPEKIGYEQARGDNCDRGAGAETSHRRQQRHSTESDILSENDCLRRIARTAELVALGVFKPSVANALRSSYRDILQHHKAKAKEAEKNLSNGDVIEVLKKDPRLLSLLEPLLSQEQVDMIMKSADGSNG